MVKKTPGWPDRSLAILNQNGQYALPLQEFPDSFQADLADFGARLQATPLDDPLDDDDLDDAAFEAKLSKRSLPPKALKATSAANRMDHARWAASGLVATGTPISEITSLDCLVSPLLNAKQILRYFKARAGGKPSAAGTHVGGVLVMIAKYHAMLPMEDAKKISSWSKGLKLKYESMTEKNRTAMDAVMHPARERLLLALPIALMKAADRLLPIAPDQSASLAFRGVAIAFLSSAPVRFFNAIGLRVDRNLQRDDPKQHIISAITIPASESKTGTPILMWVSPALNELLQEWITKYRPLRASTASPFLFPGGGDPTKPITPQGFRDAVKQVTRHHVGVALSPHQFRHLAVRVYLEAHPHDFETPRQFLGHKDTKMLQRHYAEMNMSAETKRLDEVITSRRQTLGVGPRSAKPTAKKAKPTTSLNRRGQKSHD